MVGSNKFYQEEVIVHTTNKLIGYCLFIETRVNLVRKGSRALTSLAATMVGVCVRSVRCPRLI